ncbi:YhbY family RNA-binding protein [Peptostreptococcus canis]|uniref:YhbY family RNA-binding protein n=1 Tax=Peptostreptococcus canis TaxID=1159213 RepID=A0ABR6TLN2_9FIRM|nr:YhbY family RNA-binding protein [Peptostreptococcus canis]MBC2576063.1 YhbY family RNA-binding protein [Peptostreptococcus canis]MBP1997811.1 RNA-binding protein [Peptostreptococcus canis]
MLKGKQRSYLKSLANNIKPITQIGKEGVSEDFLNSLDDMLRARELVKISILENAGLDSKETAQYICEKLRCEFVQAIGSKFTVYRKNLESPKIVFPGHEQAVAKNKRDKTKKFVTKRSAR